MNYSKTEIKDLAKAWLVISLAFAIVIAGFNSKLILIFPIMLLTVGVGFLLHELAHKYVAQKFGYKAEFRAFNQMLIFSLITSFFGFVFAAPGGVFHGRIASKQKEGLIAIAGPLVNVVLSLIFLSLYFIFPSLKFLFFYGAYVNAFLAVFNLIPLGPLDGSKVFQWNKLVWLASMIVSGGVMMGTGS